MSTSPCERSVGTAGQFTGTQRFMQTPDLSLSVDAKKLIHLAYGHDGCGYSGLRSSVRYLGASSKAFFMNAASPAASSLGGGAVRFIKGTPTCANSSSCPAGAQTHSSRTARSDVLVKECGAFAGILIVS